MTTETRITATATRKAAKLLGPDHPAVIRWRRTASGRVARINNADANPRSIGGNPSADALETAKRALIDAARVTPDGLTVDDIAALADDRSASQYDDLGDGAYGLED